MVKETDRNARKKLEPEWKQSFMSSRLYMIRDDMIRDYLRDYSELSKG